MKIEVGKKYRTRSGHIVSILYCTAQGRRVFVGKFLGYLEEWQEDGSYILGRQDRFDLIEEMPSEEPVIKESLTPENQTVQECRFVPGKKYVFNDSGYNPYTFIAINPVSEEYPYIFVNCTGAAIVLSDEGLGEWGGITEYQEPKEKKKLVGYVNVYEDGSHGSFHPTPEEAIESACENLIIRTRELSALHACVRVEIEYEEGQFDE